ncbi:MAG: hypothetical protein HKN41_07145, partial [Ilumatobacter sp.]|nr:hypothetical protein [Ilumatobacter sp.]
MSDSDAASVRDEQRERQRRRHLLGVKLRALVGDHVGSGSAVGEPLDFAPGSALVTGTHGWVYLDDRPAERLGASLAWALRREVDALHVVAESGTGVLARRAAEFDMPISVWHAHERSLVEAVAEPITPPPAVPEHHEIFRSLIADGGAVPVAEHGVLTGEVRGLEVCRVVDDHHTGATRLEVGVGEHDREAFQMLHGDVPAVESLARVVETVARHRTPGASQHPLNTLAAERLLRWRLEQEPGLVGATHVEPGEPPVRRRNLKDATPCVALGTTDAGEPLVVVCSAGVDLDLVPYAADARLARGGA